MNTKSSQLVTKGYLPKKNRVTADRITKKLKKVCKKLGIEKHNIYALRHTHATIMARSHNIKIVGVNLGHRSINTTQRYMHPNKKELIEKHNRVLWR